MAAPARADPYEEYVRTAPEFAPVRRVAPRGWDTWIYMPWRHRWSVGTGDPGGKFCRRNGINGGVIDHGRGPIEWLEAFDLRFYVDHAAGKGTLFLRGSNRADRWVAARADPRAVRPVPLDGKTLERARALLARNLEHVSKSPQRLAYALDDEVSWGTFLRPMCWRVHGDDAAYAVWLKGRKPRFVTPDFVFGQLGGTLKELDFSPFLDRMAYNDSVLANFVGALVRTANEIDPKTPCGFVGGQAPSLWGGYDYAKLCNQVQFLEVYDRGSAPEIVRSLAPHVPLVSTHFRRDGQDSWFLWSRFAHGERGAIAWCDEGWCDWAPAIAPVLKELARLGPKTHGAVWQHDGIAIYYSHPSIQVAWCLDAQAHGKTWPNRFADSELGTSHTVRKAWETALNDAGLQYDFVSYADVILSGVPKAYDTLILPACFALSDAEARRIAEFKKRGGRVVADFMCGIFDQHGRGRARGALDDLFGVRHTGDEGAADFFAGRLWVETDQDAGYAARTWRRLCGSLGVTLDRGYARAERRIRGTADYLNLSPLRYLLYREEGRAEKFRRTLVGDRRPAVAVSGDAHLEVCRWRRGDRMLLFVVQNPVLTPDNRRLVRAGRVQLEIDFGKQVRDVVDERTGRRLGDRTRVAIGFDRREAVFLSYLP